MVEYIYLSMYDVYYYSNSSISILRFRGKHFIYLTVNLVIISL